MPGLAWVTLGRIKNHIIKRNVFIDDNGGDRYHSELLP